MLLCNFLFWCTWRCPMFYICIDHVLLSHRLLFYINIDHVLLSHRLLVMVGKDGVTLYCMYSAPNRWGIKWFTAVRVAPAAGSLILTMYKLLATIASTPTLMTHSEETNCNKFIFCVQYFFIIKDIQKYPTVYYSWDMTIPSLDSHDPKHWNDIKQQI